jgi:hypothetical protein
MNTQRSGEGAANAGATLIASITIIRATTGINIAMRLIRATSLSRAGLVSPAKLYNVPTLVRRDEIPMNPWPTSENPKQGKFTRTAHDPGPISQDTGECNKHEGRGRGTEGYGVRRPRPVRTLPSWDESAMNPR